MCEAAARPNMRFVPLKNIEQQAVLSLHRVRQGFVGARTALANQIRGLLAEFGLVVPQGLSHVRGRVPELIEDASNELPGTFRLLIQRLLDHLKELDVQVGELAGQIKTSRRNSEASRKLEKIPGIGPITASALVARAARVRSADRGFGQRIPSGTAGMCPNQSPDTWLQSSLSHRRRARGLANRGRPYMTSRSAEQTSPFQA